MMLDAFRRRFEGKRSGEQESDTGSDSLRVLALTHDAEEWHSLQSLAEAEGWLLLWAHSSQRAAEIIVRHRVSVVICERTLPTEDWRHVFAILSAMKPPVCILLASDVADEYLWREVAQNRGFEILTKPFDRARVARTVRFAANWQGWAHEDSSHSISAHDTFSDGVKD